MIRKKSLVKNPALQGVAVNYRTQATYYAGQCLFPAFYTAEHAGLIPTFNNKTYLSRPTDIRRSPGSDYKRGSLQLDDDKPYVTREFGFEVPIDDKQKKVYQISFDADKAAVERSTDVVLFNHELRCHKVMQTSGVPGATLATKWDNNASSPIKDLKDAVLAIKEGAQGNIPNKLILTDQVFNVLTEHAEIIDRIKYSGATMVTKELLEKLFGINEIVIANGETNAANQGQVISPSEIWGNQAILAFSDSSQNLDVPTFGRTMTWTGETGPTGLAVESYREDNKRSLIHRARHDVWEMIVNPEAGYVFDEVLTP